MSAIRIKNWHEFQHFKDRTPPWIKLHKTILDQRDINAISDSSFRVLIGLWLLASEDHAMQGNLPPVDDIAFRLRMSNAAINKALQELKPFLIQDDINAISSRYHSDAPETETEAKKETKTETDIPACLKSVSGFESEWQEFLNHRKAKKAVPTKRAKELLLQTLSERPDKSVAALREAIVRNWTGLKWEWLDKDNSGGRKRELTASQKMNMSAEQQRKWLAEGAA
jgi:hypothetical protein